MFGAILSVGGAVVGGIFGGPAGASAGASIGGSLGGMIDGSKAESAERRSAREQRRIAQLQRQRQRKELVRDVQFAQATALAANLGAGMGLGSSMLQGQEASQRTTLKDDLGFHSLGGDLADNIWRHTRRADSYRSDQAMGAAVSSMLSTGFSLVPSGTPATTTGVSGTPTVSSTGARNWNPSTGTYTSPRNFSNQALGLKGFGD